MALRLFAVYLTVVFGPLLFAMAVWAVRDALRPPSQPQAQPQPPTPERKKEKTAAQVRQAVTAS